MINPKKNFFKKIYENKPCNESNEVHNGVNSTICHYNANVIYVQLLDLNKHV